MTINNLRKDLEKIANPAKAKILARFFKTGKGEYGEGDVFLGITVPKSRELARKYSSLSLKENKKLLKSKIHEERMIALLLLIYKFKTGDEIIKSNIYQFYLANTKYINNWDLVDLSAPFVMGNYLLDKDKDILIKLAKSKDLWERRIAIMCTLTFIRFKKDYRWTFKVAEILIKDPHDLIHKAVGWMLREAGKNISQEIEEEFLKKYYLKMPRTMLRYAIERLPEKLRKEYLQKS